MELNLKELKKTSLDKKCQGDVNLYLLKNKPETEIEKYENPILVTGQGGHHHRLTGTGFSVGKIKTGQFLVEVTGNKVTLSHEEHKPPIKLKPGVYLVDRAREKGVFDDMVAPVSD